MDTLESTVMALKRDVAANKEHSEYRHDTHEKHDDERYNRIDANLQAMTEMMTNLSAEVREGLKAAKDQIDGVAKDARHALNNQVLAMQGLVRDEVKRALEAEGLLSNSVQALERGGHGVIQKALWAGLVLAGGIVGFLVDKLLFS